MDGSTGRYSIIAINFVWVTSSEAFRRLPTLHNQHRRSHCSSYSNACFVVRSARPSAWVLRARGAFLACTSLFRLSIVGTSIHCRDTHSRNTAGRSISETHPSRLVRSAHVWSIKLHRVGAITSGCLIGWVDCTERRLIDWVDWVDCTESILAAHLYWYVLYWTPAD